MKRIDRIVYGGVSGAIGGFIILFVLGCIFNVSYWIKRGKFDDVLDTFSITFLAGFSGLFLMGIIGAIKGSREKYDLSLISWATTGFVTAVIISIPIIPWYFLVLVYTRANEGEIWTALLMLLLIYVAGIFVGLMAGVVFQKIAYRREIDEKRSDGNLYVMNRMDRIIYGTISGAIGGFITVFILGCIVVVGDISDWMKQGMLSIVFEILGMVLFATSGMFLIGIVGAIKGSREAYDFSLFSWAKTGLITTVILSVPVILPFLRMINFPMTNEWFLFPIMYIAGALSGLITGLVFQEMNWRKFEEWQELWKK